MHDGPVSRILDRLDRICEAVRLGFEVAATNPRPVVVEAMVASLRDAVRLGNELTQIVAYDDLWMALDALARRWGQIEEAGLQAQILDVDARALAHAAGDARRTILDIRDAVAVIDATQVELTVSSRDREAVGRLRTAIADLEAAADRAFVQALGEDVLGRLDAAMALLTSCAARAARERTSLQMRDIP